MSVTTAAHTLKKFDEELAGLRELVMSMAGTAEDQVRQAVAALQAGDVGLADRTVKRDREIDRMELKADEEVARVLALRAPLGIDLRTVLTLSKTVNDLERIGDEAKKIAKIARRIHREPGPRVPLIGEVAALSRRATDMLVAAMDALARLDTDRAARLSESEDDALDEAYRATLARLKDHMRQHPESIDEAVQLVFAIKALERIGDHADNIAEYVFYLVEGRDVRHPKANPATRG